MAEKLAVDDALADLLSRALKLEGFFPEFKPEHVNMLFLHSGLYAYPQGSRVVSQGEQGRDLYVIQKGTVEVRHQKEGSDVLLATMKQGDIFGEIGLLGDGVRSATVVASEASRIFRLVDSDIRYILKNNKDLGLHLETLSKERLNS